MYYKHLGFTCYLTFRLNLCVKQRFTQTFRIYNCQVILIFVRLFSEPHEKIKQRRWGSLEQLESQINLRSNDSQRVHYKTEKAKLILSAVILGFLPW